MIPWSAILCIALGVSTTVLAITAWWLSRDLDEAERKAAAAARVATRDIDGLLEEIEGLDARIDRMADEALAIDMAFVHQADRFIEATRVIAEHEATIAEQEAIIAVMRRRLCVGGEGQ